MERTYQEKKMTDQDKINYLCRFREMSMARPEDEDLRLHWQALIYSYDNDLAVRFKQDKKGVASEFNFDNEAFDAAREATKNNQFFMDRFICYEQKEGCVDYSEPDF